MHSMVDILNKLLNLDKETAIVEDGNDLLTISENETEKVFLFNDIVYSRIKKRSVYTGQYWDYFLPLASLYGKPRVLMIGLGGGTIAYQMDEIFGDKIRMDIVEINEKMVSIAEKVLPKRIRSNLFIDDGASFVARTTRRYDIILLDAYDSMRIPQQFLEEDFVRDAFQKLSKNGILTVNYALNFNGMENLNNYIRKLSKLFKVYRVDTSSTPGNIILLNSKCMEKDEMLSRIRKNFPQTKDNVHMFEYYSKMTRCGKVPYVNK